MDGQATASLECGYETQQALYDRLRTVAQRVRNNAAQVAKRAFHQGQGATIDVGYYIVLSESAAFLAFIEMGGDSDRPEAFPWEEQLGKLVTTATAHVKRDLEEKGSEFHDHEHRTKIRKDAACVEQYQWDCWRGRSDEERHDHEHLADQLAPLIPELRQKLEARDVEILLWRHVDGLSQAEIADRLGTKVGAARTAVWRALDRAAEALGPKWRELASDALRAAA